MIIIYEFKNIQSHYFKLEVHLIDRIPENEYAKVLLKISCTLIFGPLDCCINKIYFYFKQISNYCKAMNAKISNFKSLFLLLLFRNTVN